MQGRRLEQITGLIQEEVDSIIKYELEDPRIGLVSVTRINLSSDLQNVTIFVSVLEVDNEDDSRTTMRALNGAEGFIRRELATRLDLRHVPAIHFRLDRGEAHARRINQLLDEIHRAAPEDNPAPVDVSSSSVDS